MTDKPRVSSFLQILTRSVRSPLTGSSPDVYSDAQACLCLAGSLSVLAAAACLEVDLEGAVYIRSLHTRLPETCFTFFWLGFECPGCGLTRAIVQLLRGNWFSAWQYYMASFLVLPWILLQIPMGIWQVGIRRLKPQECLSKTVLRHWPTINRVVILFVAGICSMQWFIRLLF